MFQYKRGNLFQLLHHISTQQKHSRDDCIIFLLDIFSDSAFSILIVMMQHWESLIFYSQFCDATVIVKLLTIDGHLIKWLAHTHTHPQHQKSSWWLQIQDILQDSTSISNRSFQKNGCGTLRQLTSCWREKQSGEERKIHLRSEQWFCLFCIL